MKRLHISRFKKSARLSVYPERLRGIKCEETLVVKAESTPELDDSIADAVVELRARHGDLRALTDDPAVLAGMKRKPLF